MFKVLPGRIYLGPNTVYLQVSFIWHKSVIAWHIAFFTPASLTWHRVGFTWWTAVVSGIKHFFLATGKFTGHQTICSPNKFNLAPDLKKLFQLKSTLEPLIVDCSRRRDQLNPLRGRVGEGRESGGEETAAGRDNC